VANLIFQKKKKQTGREIAKSIEIRPLPLQIQSSKLCRQSLAIFAKEPPSPAVFALKLKAI